MNIIKNSPAQRRRFIDLELCQLDKIYLNSLIEYNKILNQRNKLLKDIYFKPNLKDTLDIWDLQLINYGTKIIKQREIFIQKINEIIKDIHLDLTSNKEILNLNYIKKYRNK